MNRLRSILWFVLIPFCLQAQSGEIRGKVFEDSNKNKRFDLGEPLLTDVLLSNGRDIVKTNRKGEYKINKLEGLAVFIVKPSGYQSAIKVNQVAEFYTLSEDISELDFPLYAQNEQKRSEFALLGDMQVDVMDDIHHVEKMVVEELIQNPPDLVFPLGDLAFDNLKIFEPLSKSLSLIGAPIYYVIGNHDMNFGKEKITQRDESFTRQFGPSYYALEYGEQLIIVLNNIVPTSSKEYVGKIDTVQKEFLKGILQHYPNRKITVMMHIPIEFMVDKSEFINLFDGFDEVFVATGHTHTQYHKYFERDRKPAIHQLVAGAVCGAWWQGPHDMEGIPFAMMYDGTWKGYWKLLYEGGKQKLKYKVSGRSEDKQMAIWVPEYQEWDTTLHHLNDNYIYANVFAADPYTTVEISFDGDTWSAMEYFKGVDPAYQRLIELQKQGRYKNMNSSSMVDANRKSDHLWRFPVPITTNDKPAIARIRAVSDKVSLNHTATRVFYQKKTN